MAGATNRALKAAGLPKATQAQIRVARGAGLTVQSAIQHAQAHGLPLGKAKTAGELTGWQKAAAGVKATPAERKAALVRPGTERMQASKANIATLRAQRDARRENMQRMRKRAEFSRETKQLRAAFTPEHQRAIDKAESGYGPMAALRGARQLQKRAIMDVRAARTSLQQAKDTIQTAHAAATQRAEGYKNKNPQATLAETTRAVLKSGPTARAHLAGIAQRIEDASAFRGHARAERRQATLTKEGYAIRDMADTRSPFERKRLAKEAGFSGVSKAPVVAARTTPAAIKHLVKRIALTEKLAARVLGGEGGGIAARFQRSNDALIRLTAARKK
jgi:hypothetical protein